MKKVVYNACFGGFGLSNDALYLLFVMGFPFEKSPLEGSGYSVEDFPLSASNGLRAHERYPILLQGDVLHRAPLSHYDREGTPLRSHPVLVQVVEKLGARASARFADLRVAEIGDEDLYIIEEYDGSESVTVFNPGRYVAGFTMTPLTVPEIALAKKLLAGD